MMFISMKKVIDERWASQLAVNESNGSLGVLDEIHFLVKHLYLRRWASQLAVPSQTARTVIFMFSWPSKTKSYMFAKTL